MQGINKGLEILGCVAGATKMRNIKAKADQAVGKVQRYRKEMDINIGNLLNDTNRPCQLGDAKVDITNSKRELEEDLKHLKRKAIAHIDQAIEEFTKAYDRCHIH